MAARMSFPDTGSRWRWPLSVNNSWFSKGKRPNEEHLMQLGNEYVHYYHDDRTHIGLGKQTPGARLIEQKANCSSEVCAEPRLGGLHHRYTWAQAA